ncbi:MAG: tetratricopeptide repeat protein [Caulobacter sp.]|nr:tetratricopeptide repeat protein [Caulobacter sp.]
MRVRSVLVTLAALTAVASAPPAAGQSIGRQMDLLKLEQTAGQAVSALIDSDFTTCESRLPDLRAIMNDPRFDRMRTDIRRPFLFSVIICAEIKDRPLGLAAARKLEPIAQDPMEVGAVQTIQISDALERDAMPEATRRFLKLLDAQPEVVAQWRPGMIGAFTDYLDDDPDLALSALQRITSFAWREPGSLRASKNQWALAYGWQLGDRGRTADAARAVAAADDPRVLLYVAADRRFQTAWTPADRFDWTALETADLTRARGDMAATPEKLAPVREVMSSLRALGRYDEAIQIGQALRARLQDGEAFDDREENGEWVLILLGHCLLDTGKVTEAEAVFNEAIAMGEARAPSSDARMNWAGRLLDLSRPQDALKIIAGIDLDYVTDYGEAWIDSQKACAQAGVDRKAAEATLATLRQRRDKNPGALSQALLCLNLVDEASTLLIWRLEQPEHRSGALDPFWGAKPPPFIPPWLAEFERRRQAMLAGPGVRAALDKVGRPVAVPLAGDYWGGF